MPRRIHITSSFWILLAIQIIILPLYWIVSSLLAAALHELCHLIVLRHFSVPVYKMELRACNAQLDTGPLESKEELLCALAGPLGSFLLIFLIRRFPRVAVCALIQGLYNLLPLGSMDGARILHCAFRLLHRKSPCKQDKLGVQ